MALMATVAILLRMFAGEGAEQLTRLYMTSLTGGAGIFDRR